MSSKQKRTKLSAEKEHAIASEQWERYTRARNNGHDDYVELAQICNAFYQGDQWDEDDRAALEAKGKPVLTINEIQPKVNAILGEQITRRADIRFKAVHGSKPEDAHTLTQITKHITELNKFDWVEREVFEDGIIMDGRGWFDIRMNFETNIEGDIKITSEDPLDVLIDPDAKEYDPETWNEIFTTKWKSLDDIEVMYGAGPRKRLQFAVDAGNHFGEDSVEFNNNTFGGDGDDPGNYGPQPYDTADIRRARIIERQYKKVARVDYFVDPSLGDQKEVPSAWNDTKAKKFAKQHGLDIISRVVKRVRWTVTCDKVVLHDDWSPYAGFTLVPYFCYFRRGSPFGVIRNLLSPQEQLNKADSQELHIINTTANSGWMVQKGSLANYTADALEQRGSEEGLVIEYNPNTPMPDKIKPNQIPSGLDRIAQKAGASIKTISGVNDALLGTAGNDVSGVAIDRKLTRGMNLMLGPMDNLAKTRHLVAEKILELVQTFYNDERVMHITNDDDPALEPEQVRVNVPQEDGSILNNLTLGKYGVIVATAPARDSFDEVQFAEMMSMRQSGVVIPDDAVIARSHLYKKEELAKRVRQRNGEEPPTEEQQQAIDQAKEEQAAIKQLEMQKLQEEIKELQSRTAVNMAKVQDISDVSPALRDKELELRRLEAEGNRDLRRELSADSNMTRNEQSELVAATKLATTAMQKAKEDQPKPTPPSEEK
jgi:hypothetical protein